MSTSELRRGPGWWMDLEGQWNPPESWPEASPPLPGWIRASDGTWTAPFDADLHETELRDNAPMVGRRPIPENTPTIPDLPAITPPAIPTAKPTMAKRAEPSLQFSEVEAAPRPDDEAERVMRRARNAALIAAVTASMLAAGIVVLLALL